MIPEILFMIIVFLSVSLGRNLLARATFNISEKSTNNKQVPKTTNLYMSGLFVSAAEEDIAAVQANQNKNTLGFNVFIK